MKLDCFSEGERIEKLAVKNNSKNVEGATSEKIGMEFSCLQIVCAVFVYSG